MTNETKDVNQAQTKNNTNMVSLDTVSNLAAQSTLPAYFSGKPEDQERLAALIDQIEKEAKSIVFDMDTKEGQAACRTMAANIAKAKTAIDGAGATKKAEYTRYTKAIDAERNKARDRLQTLQNEVRAPLTKIEESEKARKKHHEDRLQKISAAGDPTMTSEELKKIIDDLNEMGTGEEWEEYRADAIEAKNATLYRVTQYYNTNKQAEEDRHELRLLREKSAKLEAEAEERRKKDEMEAAAKQAAAEAIEAEKQKAAEADAESERVQNQLREQLAAQEAAAAEATRKAQEDAQRQIQEAQEARQRAEEQAKAEAAEAAKQAAEAEEKRQADAVLLKQAIADTMEDLVTGGIPKIHAKKVISLIRANKVIHLSMKI